MNWRWHYHSVVNIFFLVWFGFYSAESFRTGNWVGFIIWTAITLALSYWTIGDWQKNWEEVESEG